MFLKQPKIRQFEYLPRFYRPEAEAGEDGKRRIKFRRIVERRYQVQKRPIWLMLIILLILIFLARFFFYSVNSKQATGKFEDIKIEIVE